MHLPTLHDLHTQASQRPLYGGHYIWPSHHFSPLNAEDHRGTFYFSGNIIISSRPLVEFVVVTDNSHTFLPASYGRSAEDMLYGRWVQHAHEHNLSIGVFTLDGSVSSSLMIFHRHFFTPGGNYSLLMDSSFKTRSGRTNIFSYENTSHRILDKFAAEYNVSVDPDDSSAGLAYYERDEPYWGLPIENYGKNCWIHCKQNPGRCDYCGTWGVCCRLHRDESEYCDGTVGRKDAHVCTPSPQRWKEYQQWKEDQQVQSQQQQVQSRPIALLFYVGCFIIVSFIIWVRNWPDDSEAKTAERSKRGQTDGGRDALLLA